MKAVLVIQTANGYAVSPYSGDIPASAIPEMYVAQHLKHYSYGEFTVVQALKDFFEPEPPTQLKEAA